MHKRFITAICIFALFCIPSYALITISRDTTWGPDSVKITDNVKINDGVTLTASPGSRLVFNAGCVFLEHSANHQLHAMPYRRTGVRRGGQRGMGRVGFVLYDYRHFQG